MVFDQIYQRHCLTAINNTIVQEDGRTSLIHNLRERLSHDYKELNACIESGPVTQHLRRLGDLHEYLKPTKSHKTCFCCLLRAPEKVISCGHALCDLCVRTFGQMDPECKDTFIISDCILCGERNHKSVISLIPATAGVRLLSLDGGGIRGVIPLVYLQYMQEAITELHIPLRSMFDFVCGTSAGMLKPLGLCRHHSDLLTRTRRSDCNRHFLDVLGRGRKSREI